MTTATISSLLEALGKGAALKLTVRETAAISDYTGTGSERVNACLRGDESPDAELERSIAALDSALAKATTTAEITVYRGFPKSRADYLRKIGLRVGSVLSDAAFLSTSRSEEVAREFAEWPEGLTIRIFIPVGSKALDVTPYSQYPDEEEILLPRDTGLRIMGYDAAAQILDTKVV